VLLVQQNNEAVSARSNIHLLYGSDCMFRGAIQNVKQGLIVPGAHQLS
jgi:hypothetical protein